MNHIEFSKVTERYVYKNITKEKDKYKGLAVGENAVKRSA